MTNECTALVLLGAVLGDICGAPFRLEGTDNRYFELGTSRRVRARGSVRTLHPEVTEVSLGAVAVSEWITAGGAEPASSVLSAESLRRRLRKVYESHPRSPWTEGTRQLLSSNGTVPAAVPDWAAAVRAIPVAPLLGDDLSAALDICRACAGATCTDPDTVRMAQSLTHALHMALNGRSVSDMARVLEEAYGLQLSRGEDELRSLLRGDAQRLTRWAQAYAQPAADPPSPRIVTEAALTAVLRSDSWEDAVRRAVSLGGPSQAVAGTAGALAAAVYGNVSPTVAGRLTVFIPTDILPLTRRQEGREPGLRTAGSPPADRVGVVRSQRDSAVFVVPSGKEDLRDAVSRLRPSVRIIPPEEVPGYLASFRETRTGTYVYGDRPEVRTLYLQDGRLVTPSRSAAPGLPPVPLRRRHLEAFLSLREWCRERQEDMNAHAGNVGAGQVHYPQAYHMWIGTDRIDFLMGDTLAGSVRLDDRGLLRAEAGEYREPGGDVRFGNARERLWESRRLFSEQVCRDPARHLEQLRSEILSRLLDEGVGVGAESARDRYADGATPQEEISNLDRLGALDEPAGPVRTRHGPAGPPGPADDAQAVQPVGTVHSIGYGARSLEGFIGALRISGIDTVVDIRAVPHSRYCPQFDEETVFAALSDAGIDYYGAGEKLGGRPRDPVFRGAGGRVDWSRVRDSGPYREGIAAVEALAGQGRSVAVVSAEADPLTSHRFGLVCRSLSDDGFTLRHILPDGEVLDHARMEDRLLGKYLRRGMIPSAGSAPYAEQLAEAYDAMSREYGYRPSLSGRQRVRR